MSAPVLDLTGLPDFLADVGSRDVGGHPVIRIDNDGPCTVRLTLALAREIRTRRAEGARSLGAVYGVSTGQIYKVLNNLNWKEAA